MKKLFFLGITTIFGACHIGTPITIEPPKNNNTYNVEYLFEHEGCKVYRFRDRGQYVYFTNCKGEAIVQRDTLPPIRNSTNMKKQ